MSETNILDGKALAQTHREQVRAEVAQRTADGRTPPCLAVVVVGERPDSAQYVRSKVQACSDAGITSVTAQLPASASQAEIEAAVAQLNSDPSVHGVLVQLPLPGHVDEESVLSLISAVKDVDGFTADNVANLMVQRGRRPPLFVPCTALGCLRMLQSAGVAIEGARAVVIGRSKIVGMPTAALLMQHNATVTVCHSRTPKADLPAIVAQADIVVAACGQPELVRADWIKPGAAVLDVGCNAVPDPTRKSGLRFVGDVAFDEVKTVAGCVSPVPGGVGPMTIAMLLANTLKAAKIQQDQPSST